MGKMTHTRTHLYIWYILTSLADQDLTKNSLTAVVSPMGMGWKTARQRQVPTMARRMNPSKTFHSTISIRRFLFKIEQKMFQGSASQLLRELAHVAAMAIARSGGNCYEVCSVKHRNLPITFDSEVAWYFRIWPIGQIHIGSQILN